MNIALKLLLLTFGASIFLSTQSLDENSLSVNKRIKEYLYDMHYIPESDVLDQRSLWAKRDEHNKKVLSKSNLKIVKGGSWFDGLAYQ